MKEYLAHQWQESARQVVELETTIAAVTEQKDEAVAKVEATDRLKAFLAEKMKIQPHDRGLTLAVKDEWRKLLASEEGAELLLDE